MWIVVSRCSPRQDEAANDTAGVCHGSDVRVWEWGISKSCVLTNLVTARSWNIFATFTRHCSSATSSILFMSCGRSQRECAHYTQSSFASNFFFFFSARKLYQEGDTPSLHVTAHKHLSSKMSHYLKYFSVPVCQGCKRRWWCRVPGFLCVHFKLRTTPGTFTLVFDCPGLVKHTGQMLLM